MGCLKKWNTQTYFDNVPFRYTQMFFFLVFNKGNKIHVSCLNQCWVGIRFVDTCRIQFSQNSSQKVSVLTF
jgi:hypothetical protein